MNIDLNQCDESLDPPKPLTIALLELGDWSKSTIEILLEHETTGLEQYKGRLGCVKYTQSLIRLIYMTNF